MGDAGGELFINTEAPMPMITEREQVRIFVPLPDTIKFAEDDAAEDEGKTALIQICMTGEFSHPYYGDFEITSKHLREMQRNFKSLDREVVLDYNHSVDATPEGSKAAGWFDKDHGLKVKSGGTKLYGLVHFTEQAVEYILAGEYRFTSPEIVWEYTDPKTSKNVGAALLATALTNRPFLTGMDPVELSEGVVTVHAILPSASARSPEAEPPDDGEAAEPGGQPRTEPEGGDGMKFNDTRVREILELEESVELTDQHRADAFDKLDEYAKAEPEGVLLTETEHTQLQADATAGQEAVEQLRGVEARDKVELAIQARKAVPAERETLEKMALSTPELFAELVESRPELDPALFVEAGSGEASEDGGNAEAVGLFVQEQQKEGVVLAEAYKAATKKFGAEAFNEWRYPNRKVS